MRQQNVINLRRINRYLLILILVRSLLHTAVNQNMKPADLQIVAASRHFMGGPKKIQFHDGSFPPDVSGTRFPFRSQAAGVWSERRMHPRMKSVPACLACRFLSAARVGSLFIIENCTECVKAIWGNCPNSLTRLSLAPV